MTLDAVSYSEFVQLCNIILYLMINPTVVSLF